MAILQVDHVNAQADLNLCCLHTRSNTFLLCMAYQRNLGASSALAMPIHPSICPSVSLLDMVHSYTTVYAGFLKYYVNCS